MGLLSKASRYLAFRHGRAVGFYRKTCAPDGAEWAEFLRLHGDFHAIGAHVSIQTNVTITDPKYVRLGNNVRLSGCTLFGHDGSINMLNRAFGIRLDRVGKIDIRDNVFIGHGAIVLPGVTIGPNAIVAAGAVVSSDVEPDSVYGGVPARRICTLQRLVEKMRADSDAYPWQPLIDQRAGDFDRDLQPALDRLRVEAFFGTGSPASATPAGSFAHAERGGDAGARETAAAGGDSSCAAQRR